MDDAFSAAARPCFPARAVITAGMPYGNKDLHFGHVGGVFVHADVFARFLRDRIGRENVIFVSGTDCYGSPIVEDHRKRVEAGAFNGDLPAFVRSNHERQRATLAAYGVEPDLFSASGFGRAADLHRELGDELLRALRAHGHARPRSTPQFYDAERGTFLNGRQVTGRCPVQGCRSESAYADECSLGHQYEPEDLIAPVSALTGRRPEMREVTNWYLDLPAMRPLLEAWVAACAAEGGWRESVLSSLREHFEPPTIHVTRDQEEALGAAAAELPPHRREDEEGRSLRLIFASLHDMDAGKRLLGARGIRYRTGKTLVPFRLTGNLAWSLPAPDLDGLCGLTFWVWPESLWAPVSFTRALLESRGAGPDEWKRWWCARDAGVYQFIGEDNIFFYGLPQLGIFLGPQGPQPQLDPPDGALRPTRLIANHHLLFLDRKASSSGAVKPPMASDLLQYYTPDQLRAHFISLALGQRSVSFRPKPLNPAADAREPDPVLKEGNLLSNAVNRAVRSCFYTAQKYFDGRLPAEPAAGEVLRRCEEALRAYEWVMYHHEFQQLIVLLEGFVREINQRWSRVNPYQEDCDPAARRQALADAFQMVRAALLMLHPVAPDGTERVREYLGFGAELWDWKRAFEPLAALMPDPAAHRLRNVPPHFDFFPKHPSQVTSGGAQT